jgi:glycosyltransferase involved in cell wall biosynthesis
MNKKTLHQLYAEHIGKVSDKWSLYLTEYDRLFKDYRDKPVRLFEIGIQNGGSLEIWAKYFDNATAMLGCDINSDCAVLSYDDPRISVIIGDANAPEISKQVFQKSSQFDVIIDDGSHRSSDIIKSFALYFPHIAQGGVFIAEDLHCSYWSQFEGGLFDPYSSVSFFKRLADIISHEHWGILKARGSLLRGIFTKYGCKLDEEALTQVHSVEFINSMCVIRKAPTASNELGRRVIAGSLELVIPGFQALRDRPYELEAIYDQSSNQWTTRAMPPEEVIQPTEWALASLTQVMTERDEQIAGLAQAMGERDEQIASLAQAMDERIEQLAILTQSLSDHNGRIAGLTQGMAESQLRINALHNSTSWRMTRPLRIVAHQGKRVRRIAELTMPAVKRGGGLKNTVKKAIRLYRSEGLTGIRRAFKIVATFGQINPAPNSAEYDRNDYTEWIRRYDTLTDSTRSAMRVCIDSFLRKPLISVVMPTYNPNPQWLIAAIESVRKQVYPRWELCIADDASTDEAIHLILQRFARDDPRIKVIFRERNGHISAASNSALELATGEWVALLDHDDLLSENALFWIADSIDQNPHVRLIYSDEDKVDEVNKRFDPYFKCDWNVDLFYSHNMFSHLGAYRTDLLRKVGGFREGLEGSQDYDLALRCIECIEPKQIHHIPRVLYHWRMHAESTAHSSDAKPYAMLAGERALNEHFRRKKINAKAESNGYGYRVRYSLPDILPMVSLIIPTRNGVDLLRACVESILRKTTYTNYEILVVDNGSDDPAALRYLDELKLKSRVRVVRDNCPFNYSAINNSAVKLARGEILGLLNNDLEVISPDWLSEMVSHALRKDIGAVGAKLWYSNDTLQHGGVLLGVGGVANHAHLKILRGMHGYFSRASLIQNFSAVTAACLVIRREIYDAVGGLNEKNLQVAFNDVDFCLRVREAGFRNIWTPYAELYHYESASRGFEDTPEKQVRFNGEVQYMKDHWDEILLNDPAYSPNLTLNLADFSLAWPPRVKQINLNNSDQR